MWENNKELIICKLKEYDIEIRHEFKSEDCEVIIIPSASISIDKSEICINFCIDCKPSYAARLILILSKIKKIKEFNIGEDFIFNENNNILDGEKAEKYYEEYKKQRIIQEFMEQQSQVYFLHNAKSFHC